MDSKLNKSLRLIIEKEYEFYIYYIRINKVKNFYDSHKKYDKILVGLICDELQEPLLYVLSILIRSLKNEIWIFLSWLSKTENHDIYCSKNNIKKWNISKDNFGTIIHKLFNDNKIDKNIFDKHIKCLHAVCHYFHAKNNTHIDENEMNECRKRINKLFSDKKLIAKFFSFIKYIDCIINNKDSSTPLINSYKIGFHAIDKLELFFKQK